MRDGHVSPSGDDGMDLRELGFILRRGRLWIAGGALIGLLAGLAVLLLVPPRYKGTASILLRSQVPAGQSALSELGDLLGSLPIDLGGSVVETERTIMTSRSVLGEVVDSLGLQVKVTEPRIETAAGLFESVRVAPEVNDAEYSFVRGSEGYRVAGADSDISVRPGVPFELPDATLTLSEGELPDRFTVVLRDRETAISEIEEDLTADVLAGEVVEVVYRSGSAELAAAVPNSLIAKYLERRRTTDRGVNQYRYEFLTNHADSITRQLAFAEEALRRQQEESGVFDPELTAESGIQRVAELRAELESAQVESRALRGILEKANAGTLSPQELAAYPSFIANPAINGLLSRLLELETQRIAIIERGRYSDDEIRPLTSNIEFLESRLVAISSDYLGGLLRREAELQTELAGHQSEMSRLPAQAELGLRLQREVLRLSETEIALQTQLVAARIGAISEGGDVRQVDVAVPPENPSFPNGLLSIFGGLLGGLFFGTVAAVGAGRMRRRISTPIEAEIATGIPSIALTPLSPLSFPEAGASRSLLLIPAGPNAGVVGVGERIVTTAALQGRDAVLADLSDSGGVPLTAYSPDHSSVALVADTGMVSETGTIEVGQYAVYQAKTNGHLDGRTALMELENRASLVIAALPEVSHPSTVSVLAPGRPVVIVARAGVTREILQDTIDACNRMGATVLRIVLQPDQRRR